MRRSFQIILAVLIVVGFCISMVPTDTDAQLSENIVIVKTDYEMLGVSDLHGGGHITYELRGIAARDLRNAVLAKYDNVYGGTSGVIDSQELRYTAQEGYIADVENFLTAKLFFAGSISTVNPLHQGQGEIITTDAQGFVGIDLDDRNTPIRIYLYFDSTSSSVPYLNFRLMPRVFIDALYLYDPLSATPSSLLATGEIHTDQYPFQYKHTDYRIGLGSMYSVSPASGSMHVVRTPAGEISSYKVVFNYNDMPGSDTTASYKSFNFLENPQILFIMVFVCSYFLASLPTRFYANHKYAYPRRYRHKALKITWLHILSKVMILLLILFYFFPTMFAFISSSLFIGGLGLWIVSILFTIIIVVITKLMYDAKTADIPSEYLTPQVRRVPRRRPTPVTRTTTPAGVNVTIQQGDRQATAPAAAPAAVPTSRPQPVKKARPKGPPCVVCKKPITDFADLTKCKCGKLYHENCAEIAGNCMSCGTALVETAEPVPTTKSLQCPTCGEMNTIPEDSDPIKENCSACGVILERVEQGFNYLIVDNEPDLAYNLFVSVVKQGSAGLTISTTFPEKLRKAHDMTNCELIWLTDTSVPDQKTINPHRLEFEMMRMYSSFVKNNEKSVVILDGFEYLVVENGFDKVFKFIKKVNDLSSMNSATLFVPIGTTSLGADQLGTLKKEFDKVIVMGDD